MIKVYGASVIGASHVASKTPCQDNHHYEFLDNNEGIVACVSDGMGSASHAQLGSLTAAQFVTQFLKAEIELKNTDEEIITIIKEGFIQTNEKLLEVANENEITIKDLNATLLVFLSLGERQFYGQVGDCTLIGKEEKGYSVIAKQQRGEYANATFSICNLDSVENGIFEKVEEYYSEVALMSDGMESISISAKDKKVSELFFNPFFKVFDHANLDQDKVEESLKKFLDSKRISQKTDDDKTMLFIHMG